jgi:hypothetical protein
MKPMLELALGSSDPTVRRVAIRYKKLLQDKPGMEAFFEYYAKVQSETEVAEMEQETETESGARKKGSYTTNFVKRVKDLLQANGSPMDIKPLYEAFFAHYTQVDKVDINTFRQLLFKKRQLDKLSEKLWYTKGVGYWIAETESTDEPENSLAN